MNIGKVLHFTTYWESLWANDALCEWKRKLTSITSTLGWI